MRRWWWGVPQMSRIFESVYKLLWTYEWHGYRIRSPRSKKIKPFFSPLPCKSSAIGHLDESCNFFAHKNHLLWNCGKSKVLIYLYFRVRYLHASNISAYTKNVMMMVHSEREGVRKTFAMNAIKDGQRVMRSLLSILSAQPSPIHGNLLFVPA